MGTETLWKIQFRTAGQDRTAFVVAPNLDAALRKLNTAYAVREGGSQSLYFLAVAMAEGEFFA